MKKKIYILTLAAVFFTSTTALPLSLHYCGMMQTASFEVCEMHMEEVEVISCCGAVNQSEVYFSSVKDDCCSTKFVDSSVKDNFVITKTEIINKIHLPVILFISFNLDLSGFSQNNFYTYSSPPLLIDNNLYLTNSVLLI
jgi:hypothetical protein